MQNFLKNMKNSYEKFQVRGAIKEIMRNYGLRTISLANYYKHMDITPNVDVHSVKYDIMNGYIKLYRHNKNNTKCGDAYETVDVNIYNDVYNTITTILNSENTIPSKVKRNILVKVSR
jgi:hypothetical protein